MTSTIQIFFLTSGSAPPVDRATVSWSAAADERVVVCELVPLLGIRDIDAHPSRPGSKRCADFKVTVADGTSIYLEVSAIDADQSSDHVRLLKLGEAFNNWLNVLALALGRKMRDVLSQLARRPQPIPSASAGGLEG